MERAQADLKPVSGRNLRGRSFIGHLEFGSRPPSEGNAERRQEAEEEAKKKEPKIPEEEEEQEEHRLESAPLGQREDHGTL